MYRTDQRKLPVARRTRLHASRLALCLGAIVGAIFVTGCTSEGLSKDASTEQPALGEAQAPTPAQPQNPFEPAGEQTSDPETTNPPAGNPNPSDPETETDPDDADIPPVVEEAAPPIDPTPVTETVTRAECGDEAARISARMLDLLNETRASARNCGSQAFAAADPLVLNDKLTRAAEGHSLDMSSVNFFDHTGSNGSSIVERANAVNYNYRNLGENLAGGQPTAAAAVEGLVNSPGHCANIMNPSFTEVGVACSADTNADFRFYWTQVFGRQL